jgi:transcriptional regulator with XRE-family HTH domain
MQQYLAPNGSIPSAEKALRIADVCGVSVEWLIAGRGPREPAAAPPQMEGQPQPNGATLAEQIACIKREIAMRRNVYPKWVHSGRMRHDVATREMNAIEAVLRTLEACQLIASGSVKS